MSNLIPEKRLDKNGVLTTKHVRATPVQKSTRSMPAPALGGTPKKSPAKHKPTKKQLEPSYNVLLKEHFQTSPDLVPALPIKQKHEAMKASHTFTCSDAITYDVISAVGIPNAVAMLDAGIMGRDAALDFLKKNKLDHLAIDHSELTNEALKRGIPAAEVMNVYRKHYTFTELDNKLLLDAAEASSSKALKDLKFSPPLPVRIIEGEVNFDDINTVGITRFAKASEPNGYLLTQIIKMKRGESKFDAEQMKETILRFTDRKGSVDRMGVRMTLKIAESLGHEFASTVNDPKFGFGVAIYCRSSAEEKKAAVQYADLVSSKISSKFILETDKVAAMFKMDVDPDKAVAYLEDKTPLDQIKAIEEHGIAPSISDGFL